MNNQDCAFGGETGELMWNTAAVIASRLSMPLWFLLISGQDSNLQSISTPLCHT